MTSPNFWKDQLGVYLREIDTYLSALNDRLLPAFDGTEEKLRRIQDGRYEDAWDWEIDRDAAIAEHLTMTAVRQSLLNLWTAGLFHLFEQQAQRFLNQEVRPPRGRVHCPVEELRTEVAKPELRIAGTFEGWPQLDDLRFLANCVKHGEGKSCEELRRRRGDLVRAVCRDPDGDSPIYMPVETPLMGDDVYVEVTHFQEFANAVRGFWRWLSGAIGDRDPWA